MVFPVWMGLRQQADVNSANIVIVDATGASLGDRIAKALKTKFPQSQPPQVRTVSAEAVTKTGDDLVPRVAAKEINGFLVLDSNTTANKSVKYEGRNASSLK